jgi:hypothetical protein
MTTNSTAIAGAPTRSVSAVWGGRLLTGLIALFLVLDAGMHLWMPAPVVSAMSHLGYPPAAARGIGIVELACLALFLARRTAPIGAVLLTGLLGGAMAAHVRVGDPVFETYVFPVLVGALMWGGLYLRDARVRALVRGGRQDT